MKQFTGKADKYQIIEKIGEGGFGTVYHAWDSELRRDTALKFMHDSENWTDPQKRDLFLHEIYALAALNIPNTVRLYEAGESGDSLYFAMEYVDGQTIDAYCLKHNLSVIEKLFLFLQIAKTIQQLHDCNMIHRDLKAANIMVDSTGGVKLLDFGISVSMAANERLNSRQISGSMGYLPPEMLEGKMSWDGSCDVYALGVLLYLILTGKMPFDIDFLSIQEAHDVQISVEPSRLADSVNEPVPARLETLFSDRIAVAPEKRPTTSELTIRLESILRCDLTPNIELDLLRKKCREHTLDDFSNETLLKDPRLLDEAEKIYCFNHDFISRREENYILRSLRYAGSHSLCRCWLLIAAGILLFHVFFQGIFRQSWGDFPGGVMCAGWWLLWSGRLAHRKPYSCYSRFSWCEEALEMLFAGVLVLLAPGRIFYCFYPLFFFYFAERIRLYCIDRNDKKHRRVPTHLNWYCFWGNWPLAASLGVCLWVMLRGAVE